MKRSPDNQINTSFIDISRIKWLVFLLASSKATAYYRPAPGRTDGILERDQRPCDNGYKSVFTNFWLVRQRHRHKSELVHCLQCLLSGATGDSKKRWRVYTSIAMMACHAWRVYKSSGKTHKNRNACIDAHQTFAGLYGIRCALVKCNVHHKKFLKSNQDWQKIKILLTIFYY